MIRRGALLLVLVLVGLAGRPGGAAAHSALGTSDPLAGSVLDKGPSRVRLFFTEVPEPSLSTIRVVDSAGRTHQTASPRRADGDPAVLEVPLGTLSRGVYTVQWRILSGVDGHPTTGAFAFGVGVLPSLAASAPAGAGGPSFSWLELAGRWTFIVGLIGLLGAAFGGAAGFGRASGGNLGAAGWYAALIGLLLMTEAQRRSADVSIGDLWPTSVGHALAWRGAALAIAGTGLVVGRVGPSRTRQVGMWIAAAGAAGAMAFHVDAGHAAGSGSWRTAVIAAQWAHFAAVGIWIGGLVALLLRIRGATSTAKTVAVRRFSSAATIALAVVVATGLVRARDEIASWSELTSTGYGRGVVAKVGLVAAIGVLAFVNRWRNVRRAHSDLTPLRRAAAGEVALATAAFTVAAVLAGLSPPQVARAAERSRITVSGTDFATTVKVRLNMASSLPGANRFTIRARDYDSGRPVRASRVTLRFTPLDDPDVAPTQLTLRQESEGSYGALGNNVSFEGRWEITVQLETGTSSVVVPLTIRTRSAPQFLSVTHIPNQPTSYGVQIADKTLVGFSLDPERPGLNKLSVTFTDVIRDERAVAGVVVTTTSPSGATRQATVRRAGRGTFVADVKLVEGEQQITAIGRTPDGTRLYATFPLTVDG